jgi:hypothetical protein
VALCRPVVVALCRPVVVALCRPVVVALCRRVGQHDGVVPQEDAVLFGGGDHCVACSGCGSGIGLVQYFALN